MINEENKNTDLNDNMNENENGIINDKENIEEIVLDDSNQNIEATSSIEANKSTSGPINNYNLNQDIKTESKIINKKEHKKRNPLTFRQIMSLVLVAFLFGGIGTGVGIGSINHYYRNDLMPAYYTSSSNSAEKVNTSYTDSKNEVTNVVDKVGSSVVAITNKVYYKDYFNNTRMSKDAGSGIIFRIDNDYVYILTNNHVVANSNQLIAEISKGEMVDAKIVGADESTDLAVIKVKKSDIKAETLSLIKPLILGDSDNIKVGETAIAMGNPLGYNNTVTVGVISALNRELKGSNSLSLIQTDAAINPGNSGGPLLNSKGEVIGINSVKIAETSVEGIGFAIPINSAKPIIKELLENGYISRPYIGIYGKDIDKNASETYEVPIGVFVYDVIEGSGAARAGLKKGDIIISLDDNRINTMDDLLNVMKNYKVGDEVNLKIVRDSKDKMVLKVKLGDKNKVPTQKN
ncbi:S1C family serine protease [Helicovermis profundi]|uniref:Trypsin-like peptidase domain-containing protein n=1 Tax=Helicovermis profundi TaxID=3065157 RepID=A0AAU9E3X3_9FIRM|nr:trypsin-like peptidase domain-containing protein [Clostridia bacterium S502]